MKLLIDTHLLLWAAGQPEKLPLTARSMLEDAQNNLVFSAASIWEVAIKQRLGRVGFKADGRGDTLHVVTDRRWHKISVPELLAIIGE